MAYLLAITNQKGGVGKTTTAVNLAASLAACGRRTLLVDMDPQGNASSSLGIAKDGLARTVYDLLLDSASADEIVAPTPVENLFILPTNVDLIGAELELVDLDGREARLRKHLDSLRDRYAYIIVDSPPSLGLLTINVLTAVDHVVIPVQCEYFALEGLSLLVETIRRLRDRFNPGLRVLGVVMTMFDARTNLSAQVRAEVERVFGSRLFATSIPRSVRLSEAPSFGKPILLYDPRSAGATAYSSLCQEVIDALEKASLGSRLGLTPSGAAESGSGGGTGHGPDQANPLGDDLGGVQPAEGAF